MHVAHRTRIEYIYECIYDIHRQQNSHALYCVYLSLKTPLNSTLKLYVGAKSIFALPRVLFKMTSCPNIIIKLSSGQLILCMKGSFAQLNRSCPTDRSFAFNGVLAVTETSRVNNFRIDKFVLKALTMLQFHKIRYLNMIATSFAAVVITNIYTYIYNIYVM